MVNHSEGHPRPARRCQRERTRESSHPVRARHTCEQFTVQAFAGGMLSAFGHNPTFEARDYRGEIQSDPETGEGASLNLTIEAASLQVTDDVSGKERRTIEETMHADVLESAKYPEIAYDCPSSASTSKRTGDGQFEVALNGNLSLHGVTRRHPITARVTAGASMLRAFGEFAILQSDYGIEPVNVAGGTLKVRDELKCSFDIVARPLGRGRIGPHD